MEDRAFTSVSVHIFLLIQSPLLRLWRIVQEFFTLHCFPTSGPPTFYHRLAFHFFLQPNPPKKATTIFICKKEQKSVGSHQHGLFHFLLTSSENESCSWITQHSPEIGSFLGHKTLRIHLQWHFSKPQTYHFQQFQTLQSTRKGMNIICKGLAVHSLTVHPFLLHSRILFSR